jgi:type III secretion system chaperone SycN
VTTVPAWLNDIVRDFAAGLGLRDFALNSDGAAALRFENGTGFRMEYAAGFLVLSMSVDSPCDAAAARLLLSASDPVRRGAFAIRAGFAGKPLRAVFAVRLDPADITLGNLDAAMSELWRAVENFRRRSGA